MFAELSDQINQDSESAALWALVKEAARRGASDLHLLMERRETCISMRRWGLVEPLAVVDSATGRHYVSALKAAAEMDIAERRRPMDGRISIELDGTPVDVRINTLPTLYGEDATLRLLDPRQEVRTLDDLGMADRDHEALDNLLAHPSGLVLVTGPTGAGKTTTLYACLTKLNDGTRKINTLEDPIEYALPGVRQSQVNSAIGLDFARLLASVLRQAPDVVMVGEVRDLQTAATAVRAANSGHLVFATLHAPTAAGAVQSMLAHGVEPHFLASSLVGVVAQRLVRLLCTHCRRVCTLPVDSHPPAENQTQIPDRIYAPTGCHRCNDAGFTGRGGVFEIMPATSGVRGLIANKRPRDDIHACAVSEGMIDFREATLATLCEGQSTIEEVVRVIPADLLQVEA